jgi:phospholipid/cholesterol/gamma-HCH transport system ATP-binding protein
MSDAEDSYAAASGSAAVAEAAPPAIAFEHVSIGFDGKSVLNNISFTANAGEMVLLLGEAGTGKSVMLKLANALILPDFGHVRIFGKDIGTMPEEEMFSFRDNIGMTFQESALFDSLSVRDNVAFRMREQQVEDEIIEQRVREALRFVELEDAIDKFPAELSGGMRRRVAIARAIITRPKLLLYDSPTGGLDPITSTTIIELIMKQRDVYESTALLVTHRLQDAFMLATHRFNRAANAMERIPGDGVDPNTIIMILRNTSIAFSGSLLDLLRSDDPYIMEYLAQ